MKKLFAVMLLALALAGFNAAPAQADTIELALVLDASGSISDANYNLQRNAYASVLSALVPTDGSVRIGVWQFGYDVDQVFAMQTMTTGSLASLVSMFGSLNRGSINTGATNIGGGIQQATAAFLFTGWDKQIIDVSTDGQWNIGTDPIVAGTAALLGGVDQINCLGVGVAANCSFIMGTGSFSEAANDFADFRDALERKLARELDVVPEPGSMLLLGTGLVGLGARFRRRK